MMMYKIVSIMNPSSCMGFLPQVSTKRKVVQAPGISPATARIMFPTEMFLRLKYTLIVPVTSALGAPKPMAWRIMEVFKPSP